MSIDEVDGDAFCAYCNTYNHNTDDCDLPYWAAEHRGAHVVNGELIETEPDCPYCEDTSDILRQEDESA